nr:MAG TPA: hypothetical protein [Bacteriophage sp.]
MRLYPLLKIYICFLFLFSVCFRGCFPVRLQFNSNTKNSILQIFFCRWTEKQV